MAVGGIQCVHGRRATPTEGGQMIDTAWESCQYSQKCVFITHVVRATSKKRCYAVEIEIKRRCGPYRETFHERTLFWCPVEEGAPAQAFLNRLNPGWALDALTGE